MRLIKYQAASMSQIATILPGLRRVASVQDHRGTLLSVEQFISPSSWIGRAEESRSQHFEELV